MTDIAELIARADAWLPNEPAVLVREMRDALAAQAQEIELLKHPATWPGCMMPDGAEPCPQFTRELRRAEAAEARIRELETQPPGAASTNS